MNNEKHRAILLAFGKGREGVIFGDRNISDRAVYYPLVPYKDDKPTINVDLAVYCQITDIENDVYLVSAIDETAADIVMHKALNQEKQE